MRLDKNFIRQWANLLAILAAFFTNVLANIAPINDLTIGEISNQLFKDVLITPKSYAFAIWGLIYLGLISLGIYQALPKNKDNDYLQKIGYYLVISSTMQIVWVFLFLSRLFVLSTFAMIGILIPLVLLYLKLNISLKPRSKQHKWFINFPISVYFSWITVATVLNVALALSWIKWNGFGLSNVVWTTIVIILVAIVGIIMRITRQDKVYCGVFIWALVAIMMRHLDTLPIAIVSGISAAILLLMMFLNFKLKLTA
ncbi:tryptophan-rich sensory protein [Crocosphaera sp. Alani8]|uniref:tryptophan-rich sensory protein n=1 Tax=Crocosphaera sp. Alani8 TaxID=3038952 RepID=UPI00313E1826